MELGFQGSAQEREFLAALQVSVTRCRTKESVVTSAKGGAASETSASFFMMVSLQLAGEESVVTLKEVSATLETSASITMKVGLPVSQRCDL